MRHIRKEHALRLVRLLGFFQRHLQLLLLYHLIGDPPHDYEDDENKDAPAEKYACHDYVRVTEDSHDNVARQKQRQQDYRYIEYPVFFFPSPVLPEETRERAVSDDVEYHQRASGEYHAEDKHFVIHI